MSYDQKGRNSCVTVFGNDVGFTFRGLSLVRDGMDSRRTTDSALLLVWCVSLDKSDSEIERVQ